MEVEGKNILVVGLARSGAAAAEFLLSRGARVVVNDAKPESELKGVDSLRARGVEVVAGSHPAELFEKSEMIVVSPGVPLALEPLRRARAAGAPIISEVELAARFLRGRLIGITGSNGKTTTTTLAGELLAGAGFHTQVGGNIGAPLISLVSTSRDDGFTVIELSSFQLEAVERMRLFVSVIINITPDHMDRYDSMDNYAAAKAKVFRNQTADDFAVLNADDERVSTMGSMTEARTIFFSRRRELDEGIFLRGPALTYRDSGVERRLEFVAEINGVKFYNDSKATNVDAAIKCIEAFDGGVNVILGGKDKGGDFSSLAPVALARCSNVILIGAAADKIAAALQNTRPMRCASTMEEAVKIGLEIGKPGEIVLLAPACASFDMFDNYEHRGRVFKEAVRKLGNGE